MTTTTSSKTEWVVIGTFTNDGSEFECQVFADGFTTEEAANDAACDLALSLGSFFEQEQQGVVEVCTREQAEDVIG